MKKWEKRLLVLCLCFALAGCGEKGPKDYVLDEETFFLVMTNMQYYPQQYDASTLEFDCFTYELTDVEGNTYLCGVRKCSSGYGCTCGKDTIIGFILDSEVELPAPYRQSEDDNDKAWVHLKGHLRDSEKETIKIHAYLPDGSVDPDNIEEIVFLVFEVEEATVIEDYSDLHYYVTK